MSEKFGYAETLVIQKLLIIWLYRNFIPSQLIDTDSATKGAGGEVKKICPVKGELGIAVNLLLIFVPPAVMKSPRRIIGNIC